MRPLSPFALSFALLCVAAITGAAELTYEERREEIDRLLSPSGPDGREELDDKVRAGKARLALIHLRELSARAPGDATLHWLAGLAWSTIADEHGTRAPAGEATKSAITEYEKARRLAPDGALGESIAANLGILESKLGDFPRALVEYDRAIALHAGGRLGGSDDEGAATLHGNSAETLMALGRLDEAIGRYRAAVDMAGGSARDRALGLFGLAVALDRDEQLEKSREAIRQALALEQQLGMGPLHLLEDRGVFFMPRGEEHYYAALGQLALGHDDVAAASLRRFLEEVPGSRYAARARARLAELAASFGDARRYHLGFGPIESPPRDPEAVARMLQRSEARLAACFARTDFLDGGARGDLRVVVRGDGQVTEVLELVGPIALDRRCVLAVAREWRFGRGREGPLTVPIALEAR